MPTDGIGSVLRMAEAFALVGAAAIPFGLLGWRFGRRATPPALPAPTADDPVIALGYVLVFLAHPVALLVLGQVAEAAGLSQRFAANGESDVASVWRSLFGSLLVAPVLVAVWLGFRAACGPVGTWRAAARAVAVGVGGWLVVSPPVYAVNGLAEWVSSLGGVAPQEHPLVKVVAGADPARAVLLFAAVAAATPFAEELLFRGLLLGWLVRRPSAAAVPLGLGILVAATTAGPAARLPVAGFIAFLVVGQLAVRSRPVVAAVWASSALFAVVHASVWPTPVPLFLLGLALGAVAVRTGGVLAGTVLHGLFNAVSLVYLLRG